MLKFGFLNFTTFFIVFAYIIISLIMLAVSYNYLSQIDWKINISILGNLFNGDNIFINF